MMVEPQEAQQALTEVQRRQERVIEQLRMPAWYWPGLGGLIVVFTAAIESRGPVLTVLGSVVFAAGLGALVAVAVSRAPVQVDNRLFGVRGFLAIAGFTLALVAASLTVSFSLDAAGVRYSSTWGALVTAIGLTVGGPLLTRGLRRIVRARMLP